MKLLCGCFFSCLTLLLLTSKSKASDAFSARLMGTAGAGQAAPVITDAIFLNPAFLSFSPYKAIGLDYSRYQAAGKQLVLSDLSKASYSLTLSIADGSKDLMFQGGLAYTRLEDRQIVSLAVSKAIIEQLSIGVAGKFFWYTDTSGQTANLLDVMASLAYQPLPMVMLSLSGDSLIQAQKIFGLERRMSAGIKVYVSSRLQVFGDPQYVLGTASFQEGFGYRMGAEVKVLEDTAVRVGYFKNSYVPQFNARSTGFGLGVSWSAPRMTVDVGFISKNFAKEFMSLQLGTTILF